MALDVGDIAPITVETKNASGTLVTTDSVSVVITLPNGTALPSAALTETSTGHWEYDYVTTVAGRHEWTATATGAVDAVFGDAFEVTAAFDGLVSLEEMRAHLRLSASTDDEQLRDFILVGTDCAQQYTGRTWVRTAVVGELHNGGDRMVQLRHAPVASVSAVTENGVALTENTHYVLNGRLGWLYRGTKTAPTCWLWGRQIISASYVAAPDGGIVPPAVRHGVREMVRHLWEARRGGSGIPRQGPDTEWVPILGYSVPRRVAELWDLHGTGPLVG